MPWPNARTCRQACHAAGLAARLTAAQVLLVTVLVWMGSFPTVTRARGLQEADTAAPGLEDPPRNAQQGGPSLVNQTGIEGRRPGRSLNMYNKYINDKWLVSKTGYFLVIHQNGSVATTNEERPRMGILVFSASISNQSIVPTMFTKLPKAQPYVTTIMGKESNRFLCINRKGKVYSRQNFTSECGFNQTVQEHSFETYCQPFTRKPRRKGKGRSKTNRCRMRCLGISKRGKIRNSKRVCFTDEPAKVSTIPVTVKSSTTPGKEFPGLSMPPTTSRPRPPRPSSTRRTRPQEPCRGLFCKKDDKRGTRVPKGPRRKHRDPRGRRAGRHRRRNSRRRNMDRQRRARGGTPGEEGPLSDVT